MPEQLITAKI